MKMPWNDTLSQFVVTADHGDPRAQPPCFHTKDGIPREHIEPTVTVTAAGFFRSP